MQVQKTTQQTNFDHAKQLLDGMGTCYALLIPDVEGKGNPEFLTQIQRYNLAELKLLKRGIMELAHICDNLIDFERRTA